MKICVLGNSHVGALKRAWGNLEQQYPAVSITFFAHRANGMSGLKVADGKLIAGNTELKESLKFTSGGKDSIDPKIFDIVLIYGAGAKACIRDPEKFHSTQALKCAMHDTVEGSLSYELLLKIREVSDQHVYVGHNPLRANNAKGKQGKDELERYLQGIDDLNRHVYIPINAEIISQPTETIVAGFSTDMKFTRGSRRLPIGKKNDEAVHADTDFAHMNEEFGKLWLSKFLTHSIKVVETPSQVGSIFSRVFKNWG